MAAYDSDEEELEYRTKGFAAAAALGATHKSHEEAWMVNLGRNQDNEWLLRPRDSKWFTGLPPSECPGKCCMIKSIGSLPFASFALQSVSVLLSMQILSLFGFSLFCRSRRGWSYSVSVITQLVGSDTRVREGVF